MQKPPVFRTVGQALKGSLVAPFKLPLLFLVTLGLVVLVMYAISLLTQQEVTLFPSRLQNPVGRLGWQLLDILYQTLFISLAITPLLIGLYRWHVGQDVTPAVPLTPVGRFGRVALWHLIPQFVQLVPVTIVTWAVPLLGLSVAATGFIVLGLLMLLSVPIYRLIFAAPEMALEVPGAGAAQSWQKTKGIYWRTAWAYFFVTLAIGAVGGVAFGVFTALNHIPFDTTIVYTLPAFLRAKFGDAGIFLLRALGQLYLVVPVSLTTISLYRARFPTPAALPQLAEVFS